MGTGSAVSSAKAWATDQGLRGSFTNTKGFL
ncbi:hypothetical protein RSAG8_10615, partial [Rhizoctonia solani AG-8 WAC10335]